MLMIKKCFVFIVKSLSLEINLYYLNNKNAKHDLFKEELFYYKTMSISKQLFPRFVRSISTGLAINV